MAENTKKQDLAKGAELTLEEKINKIKSREITEAEKNMLTLPAFEAACEAVKKVTQETGLIYSKYFSDHTGNKIYFKPENMQLDRCLQAERRLLHNRYSLQRKRDREV